MGVRQGIIRVLLACGTQTSPMLPGRARPSETKSTTPGRQYLGLRSLRIPYASLNESRAFVQPPTTTIGIRKEYSTTYMACFRLVMPTRRHRGSPRVGSTGPREGSSTTLSTTLGLRCRFTRGRAGDLGLLLRSVS